MDGPIVRVDSGAKRDKTLMIVALCISIAAVSVGLIDLIGGYHREVQTCASALCTCYIANKLWPHRGFQVAAVVLFAVAISTFFVGTK
jgi:hypothetical protein